MSIQSFDRWLAHNLPSATLKDLYPRAMRRFAEMGVLDGRNVVATKHGFKMEVDRVDAIKWYIHYYGEFEPLITIAWKRLLKPGGVVLDIGGNIGYHALLAASCVGDSGKVLTFEPASKTFTDLVANIEHNSYRQISAFRQAVSDVPGEVFLHYAGDNEKGSSSIVRGDGPSEAVEAISFSDIAQLVDVETVDLIKIDVEGAEAWVIKGMMPFLEKISPNCAIFLELAPEEDGFHLIDPFIKSGFQVREIDNIYRTSFYRQPGKIALREYVGRKRLTDIILAKDEAVFSEIEGGLTI